MENETQTTSPIRQVLIVAAPNDPQAGELARALRAWWLNTTIAETAGLASALADQAAVCIIVLRPGQWRSTPSITTAIRSNPRYMIPLLAEPMPLPMGTWATEPINMKEPLSETAKELEALITTFLQTLPTSASASRQQRPSPAAFVLPPPIAHRPGRNRRIRSLLLTIGLLLVAALLLYALPRIPRSPGTPTIPQDTATSTTFLTRPYVAANPGPGCDTAGADWAVGSQFKAPVTPTGTTATARPHATPTLQVIVDPTIKTACQQNGLLVTHTDHFASYTTIIFGGNGQALPRHFSTQITATVVKATDTASFGLGVRQQGGAPGTNDTTNGYGDDTFDVGVDGGWHTWRYNDTTDQVDATFTRGFVQPAKSFTLAAEVNGPLMTFSINGHKVTTAFATTYSDSYGIDFGISDPDAKNSPSALFSHFAYTPLPDTSLSTPAAMATATAQVATAARTPYKAAVPGFGCDNGAGQWKPATVARDYVTTRCLPNGLEVSEGASEKYSGSVSFYWLNGNFPANYKVQAHIDVSALNDGSAGFLTRTDELSSQGYYFSIHADGSWQIESYDSSGNVHQLAQGQVPPRSAYTLEATSNGPTQSLALDGVQVGTVSDKTYTTTDRIDLFISPTQGSAGIAVFSNFIFTPL